MDFKLGQAYWSRVLKLAPSNAGGADVVHHVPWICVLWDVQAACGEGEVILPLTFWVSPQSSAQLSGDGTVSAHATGNAVVCFSTTKIVYCVVASSETLPMATILPLFLTDCL
jgi:hypothetical protein